MSLQHRAKFIALALLLVLAVLGCSREKYAELRTRPNNPLEPVLFMAGIDRPQPSDRTVQLLRRYALNDDFEKEPVETIAKLVELEGDEPKSEFAYALAEMSYVHAATTENKDKEVAYNAYWNTVAHAYRYLLTPRYEQRRNIFDPQFRRACDLYNVALERCLRICRDKGSFKPGASVTLPTAGGKIEVVVVTKDFNWKPEDFDEFQFTSDYEIRGLTNHHRGYGLGVPLIAVRKGRTLEQRTTETPTGDLKVEDYYPPNLSFPVTAFLRLAPNHESGEGQWRAELELYDPLQTTDIEVCGRDVPLESDLSTPLAYFLTKAEPEKTATYGLLRPDEAEQLAGLYMTQPYQPNKIPVVMIHGLWSSPMTWMEMFNDLRAQPEIRDRYQFWFFLYPTGEPFWQHAARLRADLATVRKCVDPNDYDPALKHITLVGHSMGGLISRLASIDSEDRMWKIVSDQPFERLKASDPVKETVRRIFFFEADPSIKHVITIASPHRGSTFANSFTQFIARQAISLPAAMTTGRNQLLHDNPDLFRNPDMLRLNMTSIDSLSPESPILPFIINAPKPAWVRYHNIVAVQDQSTPRERAGDGIVSYTSAHLEEIESELVVQADHASAHRVPASILEVRRILLEQLDEISPPPAEDKPKRSTVQMFEPFLLPLIPGGGGSATPKFRFPSVRPVEPSDAAPLIGPVQLPTRQPSLPLSLPVRK